MWKTKAFGENDAPSAVKHGRILVVLWSCFVSSDSGNMQRLKGKMNSIKLSRKCHSGGEEAEDPNNDSEYKVHADPPSGCQSHLPTTPSRISGGTLKVGFITQKCEY
uniref:PPUP9148 n=1 Tax=Poeciliopsis prolifica TaxID=188132 RepID=A0A0S7ESI2_9TELE